MRSLCERFRFHSLWFLVSGVESLFYKSSNLRVIQPLSSVTKNLVKFVHIFCLHLADDFAMKPDLEVQRRIAEPNIALEITFPPCLVRARMRVLDAELAEFLRRDPIGDLAQRLDGCRGSRIRERGRAY